MNLRDFTSNSIGSYPLIHKLRKHFLDKDKSIFLSPQFLGEALPEKFKQQHSNFIKIFQVLESEDPKQVAEITPYLDYIAPIGSQYINLNAFYPPLKIVSSDEQLSKWGKLFMDGRCIGAYAQTEISHGSDAQSLQTTATYNIEKKCFIMNTPNIGSIKIWSGLMGMCATHIICQAQTYIEGKHYGLQTFVVPIRDPKTYNLFPGVQAWDIGPKLGSQLVDDGSLKFTNYEIPRESLMMKFLKLEENGKVTMQGGKYAVKIGYGGMLGLRVRLIRGMLRDSYKALMIWYRSLAKAGELGFLEKTKVLSEFAYVYVGMTAINQITDMHKLFLQNIRTDVKAALESLEELHLIIAGLKTLYAWGVIDQTRRFNMEGALNNLTVSGLIESYADRVAAATYEGDNVVMLQQVAKGLCKFLHFAETGKSSKIPPFFSFLEEYKGLLEEKSADTTKLMINNSDQMMDLDKIEAFINIIGFLKIKESSDKMKDKLINGGSMKKVWNEEVQRMMVDMAFSVTKGLAFKMAKRNILSGDRLKGLQEGDADILQDLLRLNGLNLILQDVEIIIRFKIGSVDTEFADIICSARDTIVKRLERFIKHIAESSPFSEEDLLYVRNYNNNLMDGTLMSKRIGGALNEQLKEIQNYINFTSKL